MSLPRGMTVDIHAFSGALQALKQRFPTPWMWERCNEALGDRDDDTTFHTTSAGRVKQLNNAIKDLDLYDYPARPAHLVPSSHSVDQLREVLSRAPRPNTDDPGIEEHFDGFTGDTWWTWQVSYYDELFRALNDVIDVHGVGDDGWKSVRWEVYDKVRVFPIVGSCSYSPKSGSSTAIHLEEFNTTTNAVKIAGGIVPASGFRVDSVSLWMRAAPEGNALVGLYTTRNCLGPHDRSGSSHNETDSSCIMYNTQYKYIHLYQ